MRILVFAGSLRRASFNKLLARQAHSALQASGLDATLIELNAFPMPIYDGDIEAAEGLPEPARRFKQALREHDAFVIATPEYNGFFPALLKNAIDWASRAEPGEAGASAVLKGKRVALLSASPGGYGGKRALTQLREQFEAIAANVLAEQLAVGKAMEAFDAAGGLARAEDREQLSRIVAALRAES